MSSSKIEQKPGHEKLCDYCQYVIKSSSLDWFVENRFYELSTEPFNIVTYDRGYHPMHIAVLFNHMDCLKNILQTYPEFLDDQTNNYKFTPLHIAVYRKNIEAVKFLLEFGASYTLKDHQNKSVMENGWLLDHIKNGTIPHPELLHPIKEPHE